jgi:hypothetical protein
MAVRMFDLSTPDTLGPQLLANLGNSFLSGQKQAQDTALKQRQLAIDEQKRAALAGLSGIDLTTPEGQQRATSTMLQLGDPASAAQVLGLGATLRKQASEEAYNRQLNNVLGLGGGQATAPAGDGDYFSKTRSAESGGNDAARNPSSTATGRYQFLQGTWNDLARNNPDLGLTPDGRNDPAQQERAMRAFTGQNAQALTRAGIKPTDGNLYMAHFLGAGAAPNFIAAAQQDPTVPATQLVSPQVAAANRAVFFDQSGQPRSAGDVYQRMTGRFGNGETAVAGIAGGSPPQPVQMAQSGGTQSDVPQGAPAQGVVIPGQGNSSLPPGDLFPGMTTEQLRLQSMTAPQGHPAKPILDAALKARMEWERGAEGRSLDQENKRLQNQKLQREVQGENAPTVRQIKQADGSEVAVQWDSKSGRWVPLVAPEGGNPVANPKLTEQQSKDVGFFNRAQKILPRLEQQDQALTNSLSALGGAIPLAGNFLKGDLYRQAEQTGRELLAVILRKDTGAAVTDKEMDLYGNIYLPKPGDDASTIQQKRDARKTAIEGIRMGLGTADIVIRSREALQGGAQPGQPQEAPKPQAPAIKDGAIAVNPTTGERILFRGGKWVPAT